MERGGGAQKWFLVLNFPVSILFDFTFHEEQILWNVKWLLDAVCRLKMIFSSFGGKLTIDLVIFLIFF